MTKCFIDSSIIVNWMLMKLSIKEQKLITPKEDIIEKYKTFNPKAHYSYILLESIRKNNPKTDFFVSDLVLNEVISVVIERYVADEMLKDGISLKYFAKYREKIDFPTEKNMEAHFEFHNFKRDYIDSGKIKLSNKIKFYSIRYLLSKYKLDSHDSFLINQANNQKCDYFLTTDSRLRGLLKKYGKLKIEFPQTFLREI